MIDKNSAELLDVILGKVGIGEQLLSVWGNMQTLAQNLDAALLTKRQREVLHSALKIQYAVRDRSDAVDSPDEAYALVRDIENSPVEKMIVLVMNSRNVVITREEIYSGSVNSSQVRIGEVLRPAVIRRAPALIAAHNHPSGDPRPSPDDLEVTRAIYDAGRLFDIQLLDHIIVGAGAYTSLKKEGSF
jgi:DNA repair protein RadC